VLGAGVLGVAWVALSPVLFPPRSVRIAAVEAADEGDGVTPVLRGRVVEAQGWIEAAPWPVTVRPLVSGVLGDLLVVEGQAVTQGETTIARLHNLEIENALVIAQAEQVAAEARADQAAEVLRVATAIRGQLLAPRTLLAEEEGKTPVLEAALAGAREAVREAQAAREAAAVELRAQERLAGGGGGLPVARERAAILVREAEARVADREQAVLRAEAEVRTNARLVVLAREAVEDPRGLDGDVATATAAEAVARAEVEAARARVSVAQRNHDHLTVRAPLTGRVMRLEAAPGALVGPMGDFKEMGEPGASGTLNRMTGTICQLYDPARLQARIDVPLASLRGLAPGTPVEVTVEGVTHGALAGVIDRVLREADLNKNTLQVKVKLPEVPDEVRPEMLCRARFTVEAATAPPGSDPHAGHAGHGSPGATDASLPTWWVPDDAVVDGAVFVYDPAARRAVRTAATVLESHEGRTRIRADLGRSSKVVRAALGLEDGARVEAQP
jgi:multidrug efflux pump subunit AcrA (membrane-fusion protein)